ncbi:MAG: phenol hydroxylase [Rhodospirillales bacterium]|nr:phenol hydroxylase [Rhodospirillales bacterium]
MSLSDQSDHVRYVRVTNVRRDRFVEFQFLWGGPGLSIDLVLPYPAFTEFCADNKAVILPADAQAQQALDRLEKRNAAAASPTP